MHGDALSVQMIGGVSSVYLVQRTVLVVNAIQRMENATSVCGAIGERNVRRNARVSIAGDVIIGQMSAQIVVGVGVINVSLVQRTVINVT